MECTHRDLLDSLLDYLPAYRLLVCRLHGACVLTSHLQSHLRKQHSLSSTACRALWEELQAQSETRPLLGTDRDLRTYLQLPTTPISRIPQLPLWTGFLCPMQDRQTGLPCRRIYRCLKNIQAHCRNEHGWKNPQGQSQPRKSAASQIVHFVKVSCQMFFA
ncbi:hypothetical protein DM02DRAFT_548191 [Periconia macrospinosa]|uniref:Uncharacterized protein n=1 Tax=Periconia macrospinosa TaxID=97972 RepID=A0A2V1CY90_9PLEO|nr:hypothetical protein DM02DRAFT_548191 [Periconia macrospinosa]